MVISCHIFPVGIIIVVSMLAMFLHTQYITAYSVYLIAQVKVVFPLFPLSQQQC